MAEWTDFAVEELGKLYVETDVPSDSLIKDKNLLSNFTVTLNSRLGNDDDFNIEEVATKLLQIRKSGKLPTIRS